MKPEIKRAEKLLDDISAGKGDQGKNMEALVQFMQDHLFESAQLYFSRRDAALLEEMMPSLRAKEFIQVSALEAACAKLHIHNDAGAARVMIDSASKSLFEAKRLAPACPGIRPLDRMERWLDSCIPPLEVICSQ